MHATNHVWSLTNHMHSDLYTFWAVQVFQCFEKSAHNRQKKYHGSQEMTFIRESSQGSSAESQCCSSNACQRLVYFASVNIFEGLLNRICCLSWRVQHEQTKQF